MENVISEFRIVETDDGYRIEIKGNKEAIRRMLGNFGPHGFWGGPFRRGFRFGFGPGPGFWGGFYDPSQGAEPHRSPPDDKV